MAVEFGIITSVVPPGGWHYPQELSTGGTHRIIGFSFEELLANMVEFRTRHLELCGGHQNISIEAVRRDLKAYLCKHFRQNCGDSPGPQAGQPIARPSRPRPIDRAANWLAERAKTPVNLVDLALATHRAEICAQCPLNIHWQTGCAPCNANVEVRIQQLKANQRTQWDSRLFLCRVFGHINSVAVWMTDTQSPPDLAPPPHCWHQTEASV